MKKYLYGTLVCLMLFSACARPLPACARAGSSTCQVTATAGEAQTPSEPGDGEQDKPDTGDGEQEKPEPGDRPEEPNPGNGQPEEPGPGDESGEPSPGEGEPETSNPGKGQPEEPDSGKGQPALPDDTGTGDGTQPGEDGAPEAGQEPGDDAPGQGGKQEPAGGQAGSTPEAGQGTQPAESTGPAREGGTAARDDDTPQPQPETEPFQTGEPGQAEPSGEPGENSQWPLKLLAVLTALCILAVLVATGVLRYIWTWLLFAFFKRSRRRFHGILTKEKNFFIRVRAAGSSSRLVQEIIDSAGSLAEYEAGIRKGPAVTEIPCQCRMRFSYTDKGGRKRCRETAAEEERMFRILGDWTVRGMWR